MVRQIFLNIGFHLENTYSSRFMGSVVVGVDFLFRCERPLRSLRKDSLRDFFKDFRLDIGLSSAFAMSENIKTFKLQFKQINLVQAKISHILFQRMLIS